jgi:acyl carrier protein
MHVATLDRTVADRKRIEDWMVRHIGSVLGIAKEQFPIADRFDTYGLDSVEAVIMAGLMEEEFGVPIDPMSLFEHPSVEAYAGYLSGKIAERPRA